MFCLEQAFDREDLLALFVQRTVPLTDHFFILAQVAESLVQVACQLEGVDEEDADEHDELPRLLLVLWD